MRTATSSMPKSGTRFAVLAALVAALVCCLAFTAAAFAEGENGTGDTGSDSSITRLEDVGTEIDKAEAQIIDLDTSNVTFGGTGFDGSSLAMVEGTTYSITYKNGLKYGGKTLTVKAEATLTKDGRLDDDGNPIRYRQIQTGEDADGKATYKYVRILKENDPYDDADYNRSDDTIKGTTYSGEDYPVASIVYATVSVYQATSDGRLAVSWVRTDHTEVHWKVTTYDESGNEYGTVLLTGILDPDESDYLFDTTKKNLFYVSSTYSGSDDREFGHSFEVDDKGVYPLNLNDERSNNGFDEALLLVTMDNGSTFDFTSMTYSGGYLATPYFYSPIYKVTYTLDDGDETGVNDPDNPDHYLPGESYDIKNPTRPGYKFIRWDRVDENGNPVPYDKIDDTDARDLHFIAVWQRDDKYTLNKVRVDAVGQTEKAKSLLVPGSEAVYLVTMTNTGDVAIGEGLQVVDKPASNITLSAVSTESGKAEIKDGNAVWTVGEIPVGGTAQMWVTAQVPDDAKGVAKNTATASDPDNPDDPGTTVEVEDPIVVLTISKVADVQEAQLGDTITYTIEVANESAADANGMLVTDTMGAGLQYVSDDSDGSASGKTITWQVDVPAGKITAIKVHAKVIAGASDAVVNTVALTDPNNPNKTIKPIDTGEATVPVTTSTPVTATAKKSTPTAVRTTPGTGDGAAPFAFVVLAASCVLTVAARRQTDTKRQ